MRVVVSQPCIYRCYSGRYQILPYCQIWWWWHFEPIGKTQQAAMASDWLKMSPLPNLTMSRTTPLDVVKLCHIVEFDIMAAFWANRRGHRAATASLVGSNCHHYRAKFDMAECENVQNSTLCWWMHSRSHVYVQMLLLPFCFVFWSLCLPVCAFASCVIYLVSDE